MPVLSTQKSCHWCQRIKKDKKLLRRIYASGYYQKGGESLRSISTDIAGNYGQYRSLLNHCRYHQGLTDSDLTERKLERMAKDTTTKLIKKNVQTNSARQDVIDQLANATADVDLNRVPAEKLLDLLLKATKHADDVAAKAKDQDIDILRIMAGARSGQLENPQAVDYVEAEVAEPFDPWKDDESDPGNS